MLKTTSFSFYPAITTLLFIYCSGTFKSRISVVQAFSSLPPAISSCPSSSSSLVSLEMMDPLLLNVGIAVVSGALGAVSQSPRIKELEKELSETKISLYEAHNELEYKIKELDDKLFAMDQEYEAQTERFKRQYDKVMKDELERRSQKMKVEFQYNLEIKLEEQKSKLLAKQLNNGNLPRQEELMNLKLTQQRIDKMNKELESALQESQHELNRLQAAASSKKGWWPF